MSGRRSPTFSKPSPSKLRDPQDKIPASGSEGRKSEAHAADCRFSIVDFRLPIPSHCGTPIPYSRSGLLHPQSQIVNRQSTIAKGALTLRDVKNEGRPGYVYENTETDDKMSGEKTGFYTKMHSLRENHQESAGFLGRKCISYTIRQDARQ
jgi:hypothetical protein